MSFYIATIAFLLSIKEVRDKKGIGFFYSNHKKKKSRFLYKSHLGIDFSFLKYKN
jgi:hypothetical protein